MVSSVKDADGPYSTVTGALSHPASGISVLKARCVPTGAAMYLVKNGLLRCSSWWLDHQMFQTKLDTSAVAGSLPSAR